MKNEFKQKNYEDIITQIEATKDTATKEKRYKEEFYPKPIGKMGNLGLKLELGLKTKEALVKNSAKNKLSFEAFVEKLDRYRVKPVLEKNERGNLEINYNVYTYDKDKKQVDITRVEGNQIPHQTKVYAKVDVKEEYEKMISRQRNRELGENKTDGKKPGNTADTLAEAKRNDLREMINRNINRGDRIEIKVKRGEISFKVPNDKQLEKELNAIPKKEALSILERNNNIIDKNQYISVSDKNKLEASINNAYPSPRIKNDDAKKLKL